MRKATCRTPVLTVGTLGGVVTVDMELQPTKYAAKTSIEARFNPIKPLVFCAVVNVTALATL
jgi:hypothetical protein